MFQREGLRLGDLTPAQRTAVMTLLSTALSEDGYRKVTEIMRGDEVLRRGQGGGGRARGPGGRPGGGGAASAFGEDEYYLAFLGTPSATAPWMLQFGGHHLAINLTMAGSQATMAPSLPAAQPATYTFEGRTVRPLGNENDKAFALINALDDDAAQAGHPRLPRGRPRARARPGRTHHSARRHSRVGALGGAADDAAGPRAGVGRHHERRVRRAADGRDPGEPPADTTSPGAARRPTAAPRTSASRGRRSSSSTRRRAASITSTPSIAIRPTTTVRSSRGSRRAGGVLALTIDRRRRRRWCRRIGGTSTCRRRGSPSIPAACRSSWT